MSGMAKDSNSQDAANESAQSALERGAAHNQALARTPYNNGYGDFCFGSWLFSIPSDSEYDQEELDGFVRTGSFAFFELPLEIRKNVYRLILGPMYQYDKKLKASYISFRLQKGERYEDIRVRDVQFSERSSFSGFDMSSDKASQIWRTVKVTDKFYWEWLRSLSNVNTILRQELGSTIWERVHISTALIESRDCPDFSLQLLKARPAVHKGIKYLTTWVDLDSISLNTCDAVMNLLGLEKIYIDGALVLNLDYFDIEIEVDEDDLPGLLSNPDFVRIAEACRRMKVSKRFRCRLDVDRSSPRNTEYFDKVSKHEDLYNDLMLPNTLRQKLKADNMEVHLATRNST